MPEKTEEEFQSYAHARRWFKTGDIGEFQGRERDYSHLPHFLSLLVAHLHVKAHDCGSHCIVGALLLTLIRDVPPSCLGSS